MRTLLLSLLAAIGVSAAWFLPGHGPSTSASLARAAADRTGGSSPPRVVLFIGDGMGLATVTAARIHRGTLTGLPHPSEGRLRIDEAPALALVRTHSADRLVTDSAAAATAILTGHKVPNGVVCLRSADSDLPGTTTSSGDLRAASGATASAASGNTADAASGSDSARHGVQSRRGTNGMTPAGGDTLLTVLEIAKAQGLGTGVVTTTRVTHATPACSYAHVPDRDAEEAIAAALVPGRGNRLLEDGIDVVLGGGASNFLPKRPGTPGRREDGRDILSELDGAGYRVVRTRTGLAAARESGERKLFGTFAPSHMSYSLDRERTSPDEPSLLEMVVAAVSILEQDPNGYFLLVEGGRIDHAHHETNGRRAIQEMLDFDEAIGWTLDRLGPEALVLVTADHDHSMVLAGYADAEGGVFSQAGTDRDGIPYTTILYANGPGGEAPSELTPGILANPGFRERAGVPLSSETHGATDVPLYLFGPLDRIPMASGTIDNTDIFALMEAAILGNR